MSIIRKHNGNKNLSQAATIISSITLNANTYFERMKVNWVQDKSSLTAAEKKFFDTIVIPAIKSWTPDKRKLQVELQFKSYSTQHISSIIYTICEWLNFWDRLID